MGSVYDQIGGTAAVGATMDELDARVLGDPNLARRGMAEVHAGLGIAARDFDGVASHMAGALRSLGVPTEQVQAVLARIAPLRDEIVC